MKIVVLDGYGLNPGDLSWNWLGKYGDYTVFDRTDRNDIVSRSIDADILVTNKTPLDKDILSKLNNVKYIPLLSTGYNVVDVEYAAERNIPVSNIPSYSTHTVAQMTFAFILEFTSQVGCHSNSVRNGDWNNCLDFCYWKKQLTEIAGKTIGIIGYGSIGKEVAKIAEAFSMNVLVNTNHPSEDTDNLHFVELDKLLEKSDFVTLHCPLTPKTAEIVNSDFLTKMKKTAYLINTSRGGVVNEEALKYALDNKVIAGAGLDVLVSEPPKDYGITKNENALITPHIAWAAKETRERLMKIAEDNIKSFINGKTENVVNNVK